MNDTSFEWTGVDKNRQNRQTYANLSKIGVKIGVINTTYQWLDEGNLATSACKFLELNCAGPFCHIVNF